MNHKSVMMILCAGLAALAETLPPPYMKLPDKLPSQKEIAEERWLDSLANPASWSPAEAQMLPAEPVDGHPAVTFHVPVDHFAGEVKYPIGWPRAYFNSASSIEWKNYDYIQFKVFAKMNRDTMPAKALALAFRSPDRGKSYELSIGKANLRLNEWQTFTLPLSRLSTLPSVSSIGFYVSESNYNHGDVLDFTVGGIRLVRSSAIKLTSMECDGVSYGRTPVLKIRVNAEGTGADIGKGVPFEIADAKGKSIRHETLPVMRGFQSIAMDISELRLPPGDYKLTAFPENAEKRLCVGFKIIDSPWEVKK